MKDLKTFLGAALLTVGLVIGNASPAEQPDKWVNAPSPDLFQELLEFLKYPVLVLDNDPQGFYDEIPPRNL